MPCAVGALSPCAGTGSRRRDAQRHEEPKSANDDYEQGTYVYFDYNIVHDDQHSGWCYRLKQDFLFKYDALENEF